MKSISKTLIPIIILLTCLNVAGKNTDITISSKKLQVGGDPNKTYFLIGPKKGEKPPEKGYKLLVVLPGGNGSADFHPFVKQIYKQGLPDGYIVAQLVAVKWTKNQQTIWPHKKNKVPKMKFGTEKYIEDVIADVQQKYKVNPNHIFTLSWSSGGPAAYAASLQQKTPITGSYIAMSVYNKKQLPSLSRAKGRGYYIEHSPDDKVCPFRMAEKAKKDLTYSKAKVKFSKYEGGHGWHGNFFGRIRKAIMWLEDNTKQGI